MERQTLFYNNSCSNNSFDNAFAMCSTLYILYGFFIISAVSLVSDVEKWDIFEISLFGPSTGNPFVDVSLSANFTSPSNILFSFVNGFYDDNGIYKIRFMPNELGLWKYITMSNIKTLSSQNGTFNVIKPSGNNYGPVYSKENINSEERPYFIYAETEEIWFESGTTAYSWQHFPDLYLQNETISTIRYIFNNKIFNKIRFSIFPLYQEWSFSEPLYYPYIGKPPNNWGNFDKFNVTFWKHLDYILLQLKEIGIIADVIIFRPYDYGHWGFDCMGCPYPYYNTCNANDYNITNDLFYLKYLISRISSYRNVWWSMSNEYDVTKCKNSYYGTNMVNYTIWDKYFEYLISIDPYKNPEKEKSMHQGQIMYNYSQSWVTHFSIQGYQNVDYKYFYEKYNVQKPIIIDEMQYEGNITAGWGDLNGAQELYRYWEGTSTGRLMGHSECLLPNKTVIPQNETVVTWWNYGGKLIGESYKKIKWYNSFWNNITMHPPFHKLFTYCYVYGIYNSWNTKNMNVTDACYVSQLYDKFNSSYYFIRWIDPTNTDSKYAAKYNTTINIKLEKGQYVMYKINEWNKTIVLIDDNVEIIGNEGYTYSAKQLPQSIQFINKNSTYFV